MVFGNDVSVPQRLLSRLGPLTHPVEFYFLFPDQRGLQRLSW